MAETYSIQTSVHINAPATKIYDRMLDLHEFNSWNPFPVYDPSTVSSVTQTKPGVGSVYEYQGDKIGKGQQVVKSVTKPSLIVSEMSFFSKKKTDVAHIEFRIDADTTGSLVTWYMQGERNFVGSFMGRVLGFDKMMRKSFATGLERLKRLMEAEK